MVMVSFSLWFTNLLFLFQECNMMKTKLDELSCGVSAPVPSPAPTPSSPIKIATLGAGKKSKSKRGKGNRNSLSETSTTETFEVAKTAEVLTTQVQSLENRILELEEQLTTSETEKSTLQQRVQLLLVELNTESAGSFKIS